MPSPALAQIAAVFRLEVRKSFFARRSLWVYLLALAPLLLFFGGQDQMIPQEQVQKVEEALTQHGKDHQLKVYPEAGHGFNCDARASYNKEAADDAAKITADFLAKHLK